MDIEVIFKGLKHKHPNINILDETLINSLKKYHTRGFRINTPVWLDKEHESLNISVKLDEINELDNRLDYESYNRKRSTAVNHVIFVLVNYLYKKFDLPIMNVVCFSVAAGKLFPGSYDLKRVDFYIEGDERRDFVFLASLVLRNSGEYWSYNPTVIV